MQGPILPSTFLTVRDKPSDLRLEMHLVQFMSKTIYRDGIRIFITDQFLHTITLTSHIVSTNATLFVVAVL